ncbi:MAG: pilus assembly protein, partial [Clostridia bacterium]|nr:pilus assembly protein [Clostridia bacterium]
MWRAIVLASWPWALTLIGAILAAVVLLRWSGSGRISFRWSRFAELLRDDVGAVQSLSFVLTLPFFVLLMLFIVQVSQIMIGTVVVHYAAFAAARAAQVWIPARVGDIELENCIGPGYYPDPTAEQVVPILDPSDPNY